MIEIKNITKKYGKNTVLNNISMKLNEEEIYCLIGRNGAGKSTLMKIIAGYVEATSGDVLIDKVKIDTLHMSEDVKFVEETSKHFNISIKELFKASKVFNKNWDEDFASEMISLLNLDIKKKFSQLSFGMKSMVNAVIALSSNCKYTLLDEPVIGFDPIVRQKFYDLVKKSYLKNPRTIVISTHMVDEVTSIVDNLIILDDGELYLNETLDDFNEKSYLMIGPIEIIDETTEDLNVLSEETIGQYKIVNVFDKKPLYIDESISYERSSVQRTFIHLLGGKN